MDLVFLFGKGWAMDSVRGLLVFHKNILQYAVKNDILMEVLENTSYDFNFEIL